MGGGAGVLKTRTYAMLSVYLTKLTPILSYQRQFGSFLAVKSMLKVIERNENQWDRGEGKWKVRKPTGVFYNVFAYVEGGGAVSESIRN